MHVYQSDIHSMLTTELQLKQLPLFIPMADNHNMKYTEFLRDPPCICLFERVCALIPYIVSNAKNNCHKAPVTSLAVCNDFTGCPSLNVLTRFLKTLRIYCK